MTGAEWRTVPGWDGWYEVSDAGQVRSLDRTVHFITRWGTPAIMPKRGCVLSPKTHPAGHLLVGLGPKPIDRYVHHLVLEAFIGPMPEGMEGLHENGDPSDNRLANLRWGTRGENNLDAVRHGTHGMARKDVCPRGHDLRAPNLVRSKLPKRQCLACDRSKRSAAYYGYSSDWVQRDSDRRYREIMAGAAPVAARHGAGGVPAQRSAQLDAAPARANSAPTPVPSTVPTGSA